MGSRITMVLAVLFLFGALAAGYWGLVLSRHPEEPAPAPVVSAPASQVATVVDDETRQPVVVLRRDVAANVPLTEQDLTVERLQVAPAGSFQRIEQVLGRSSWRNLGAGTWLEASSFEAGGPLARMIRPGERALALAVDEVVGAAGLIEPGDYVDVLVFLREEGSNPQASAQVVVPALRLLSVGQLLGVANDGRPAEAADPKVREEQRRNMARSVVLAVPEALASQLLLAAQAGTLRLAVRSAEEKRLEHFWADPLAVDSGVATASRDLYRFSQLAQVQPPAPARVSSPPRPMEIIRGAQSSAQTH